MRKNRERVRRAMLKLRAEPETAAHEADFAHPAPRREALSLLVFAAVDVFKAHHPRYVAHFAGLRRARRGHLRLGA